MKPRDSKNKGKDQTLKQVKFNLRKTKKHHYDISPVKQKHSKIVKEFLKTLDMIKLYHWKTDSYATHEATDELHEHLSKNIDQFVEVLMGKNGTRVKLLDHHLHLYRVTTKTQFKNKIYEFRQFLIDLERTFDPNTDGDIFTIRDEMLVHINQFLYLLTLNK